MREGDLDRCDGSRRLIDLFYEDGIGQYQIIFFAQQVRDLDDGLVSRVSLLGGPCHSESMEASGGGQTNALPSGEGEVLELLRREVGAEGGLIEAATCGGAFQRTQGEGRGGRHDPAGLLSST